MEVVLPVRSATTVRWLPEILLALGAGCEPVTLRLGAVGTPDGTAVPDATAMADVAVTPWAGDDAAEAAGPGDLPAFCVPDCVGGRVCAGGECLPHWLPIEAPEIADTGPRVGHFAVWTGREVIVWGGRDPTVAGAGGIYGDGYRFDPVRNEVRAISMAAAPSPRFNDGPQTAVWTGQEMIVWGGRSAGGDLSDGGAYLPGLDQWQALGAGLTPRSRFTAVFTGTDLLVWGGEQGQVADGDGGRLRVSSGSWVATPGGTPRARSGHSAVWTGAEMIVWGGVDDAGERLSDGWRLTPVGDIWRPLAPAGTLGGRTDHTAVWTGAEMIVYGGRAGGDVPQGDGAAYAPALDRWRPLGMRGAPGARYGHVAVWTGRAMIVWGGRDATGALGDGAVFDPWTDRWQRLAPVPEGHAREGAQGVWTGAELVMVGGTDGGPRLDPFGWRYQP